MSRSSSTSSGRNSTRTKTEFWTKRRPRSSSNSSTNIPNSNLSRTIFWETWTSTKMDSSPKKSSTPTFTPKAINWFYVLSVGTRLPGTWREKSLCPSSSSRKWVCSPSVFVFLFQFHLNRSSLIKATRVPFSCYSLRIEDSRGSSLSPVVYLLVWRWSTCGLLRWNF